MSELMEDGYPEDLTGLKFGKLTVICRCELSKKNSYRCRCECGREIDLYRCNLVSAHRKSCGKCAYKKVYSGDSHTRFYREYYGMIFRCYNPNDKAYDRYGGRGIKVCDRWLLSYLNFKEDMYDSYIKHVEEFGEKDTQLDRWPNNDGDYEPNNVRWATRKEQARNRRDNHIITFNGETKPLSSHIEDSTLKDSTVRNRMCRGWNIEDALTVPTQKYIFWQYMGKPLSEYCREFGIDYALVISRVDNGWDIDSAINAPKGVAYDAWMNRDSDEVFELKTKYIYNGISVWEYCKIHGISYNTVQYRITHGWDIDSAINLSVKLGRFKYYYQDMPVKDYCLKRGISIDMVRTRIKHGWDIESAVEAPKGMRYKTWLKMKENNKNSLDDGE